MKEAHLRRVMDVFHGFEGLAPRFVKSTRVQQDHQVSIETVLEGMEVDVIDVITKWVLNLTSDEVDALEHKN